MSDTSIETMVREEKTGTDKCMWCRDRERDREIELRRKVIRRRRNIHVCLYKPL